MSLPSRSQSPTPGAMVSLFRFDATSVGGTVHFFVQGAFGAGPVLFGGQPYTAVDIDFTEVEMSAGGTLPQPKLSISNTDMMVQGMINAFGDLVGCELRRVRVFAINLDDGSDPDPTAYLGPDVFRIDRKSNENPIFVEWELSAAIDQEGAMIPRRLVLRDTCTKRYRIYAPDHPDALEDGFLYSQFDPCPYTGGTFFSIVDQTTTNANDRCSHHLTGCEARFGANNPLPFGGFPGVARVRA